MPNLNDDFSVRVAVHASQSPWIESPMPGVERKMLDRIGDEVARATSIVRYAPGSHFSPHNHDGGEEFLVLEGTFQDETGDFPAGTYVRNPPGTSHTPGSEAGCVILVKLWQFHPQDQERTVLDINQESLAVARGRPAPFSVRLYSSKYERVEVAAWAAGADMTIPCPAGAEFFVLEGSFSDGDEVFSAYDWLRVPCDHTVNLVAGEAGVSIWIKSGHLRDVQTVPAV